MGSTLSEDWRREHDYGKIYDYLHDFVGCSQKQKLMDDLSRYLLQQKVHWASKNNVLPSMEAALIIVSEPSTKEILDLGGTLPGDLFVDFFGALNAAIFRGGATGDTVVGGTVKDTGGAARSVNAWGNAITNPNLSFTTSTGGAVIGTQMQIGSSVSAATRADFQIGTAFSTAPENALFGTGSGSYAAGSGTITVSGSITAGNESATINEAILVYLLADVSGVARSIAICHDATTGTAFSNAKSITVQYSLTD